MTDFAVKNANNNFSASQTISTGGGSITLVDTDTSHAMSVLPANGYLQYEDNSVSSTQVLQFADLYTAAGGGGLDPTPVNYTVTLPAATCTLAGLGLAQTFSALQTFTAGITADSLYVSGGATFSSTVDVFGDLHAPNIVYSFGGKTGTVGAGITSTQILYWSANDVTGSNNFTFDGVDVVTLADTGTLYGKVLGSNSCTHQEHIGRNYHKRNSALRNGFCRK
jgi:hypothetical protein